MTTAAIEEPGLLRRAVPVLVVAAVVAALYFAWNILVRWTQYHFGFQRNDGNSPYYLFWSGSGSDLGYWSFVAAAVVYYRKANCKKRLCWRLGHHQLTDPADGVTRGLCWRHHPAVKHKHLTNELILAIHARADAAAKAAAGAPALLDEIHRHVTALSPQAGHFPPPKEGAQ